MTALGPASAPSALMRLEFHLHCTPTGGGGSIAEAVLGVSFGSGRADGREMDACFAVGMTRGEKLVREPDPPVILIISPGGGDAAGGGGMTMDESEDSRVASSPDPAAKLISMPAAAIFPGDEAEVGDPDCSFEPTKQESQM